MTIDKLILNEAAKEIGEPITEELSKVYDKMIDKIHDKNKELSEFKLDEREVVKAIISAYEIFKKYKYVDFICKTDSETREGFFAVGNGYKSASEEDMNLQRSYHGYADTSGSRATAYIKPVNQPACFFED